MVACPGDERGEVEDGIGKAVRRKFGEPPEEQGEYQHVEDGLQDDPDDADRSLFVADLNAAPNEEVEEFPVGADLAETKLEEPARRLNADRFGAAGGERKSSRLR